MSWTAVETNTHQDRVIAHVIGASILGHFVLDETAFLLLDIGFIWNIYLNAEMGLLPHPVAISELSVPEESKQTLQAEVDKLLVGQDQVDSKLISANYRSSPVIAVSLLEQPDARRIDIECEAGFVIIETSIRNAEVKVMTDDESNLAETVKEEAEFLREKLREQFGREPTEEELNEWLREHTESY